MKKLLLLFGMMIFGLQPSFAQDGDLLLGVNIGLPVGDISDYSGFTAGADLGYLFGVADIIQVGPTAGYKHFFTEDGFDDIKFIPVGVAGRVNLLSAVLGLDLGYGIGVTTGIDGGFFFRPKVGFSLLMLDIIASYTNFSIGDNNVDVSSVNLGLEFKL